MSTSTVERTGDWDTVSFAGGYAGLSDLADEEFSGTVTAGPARLFMLRGSVIGILDGDIEDFEEAGGTAREAPHPALPLLAVMQERSEEVRAEYYTEETPISEVDRTLSDGNFTGYIELSENVLSGDYYQVYHQGHSMSVAYVGASERLIEDDEAFEQADDEVGIYEVRPVDIDVVEIPEPAGGGTTSAGAAESGAAGAAAGGASAASAVDEDASAETEEAAADSSDGTAETEDSPDEAGAARADAAEDSPEGTTASTADDEADADTTASTASADEIGDAESAAGDSATDAVESSDDVDTPSTEDAAGDTSATGAASAEAGGESAGEEPAGDGAAGGGSAGGGAADDESAGGAADGDAAAERAPVEESTADAASPADAGTSSEGSPAERTSTESETAGTRSDQEGETGIPDAVAGNRSAGGTRRGEPAPDHPAAGSGGSSGRRAADSGGDDTGGALAPGDLEMRSLPSLDPERTASASKQERARRSASGSTAAAAGAGAAGASAGAAADQAREPATESETPKSGDGAPPASAATDAESGTGADGRATGAGGADESVGEPAAEDTATDDGASNETTAAEDASDESASEAESTAAAAADLDDAEADAERLESELEELRSEHEDVVAERDRLESELAEAREEIERLRDRLEEATGQAAEATTKLSPREAIDETNLFIRYDSKGEATLEKAHAGEVDKDAVDGNLRLEYHTSFDADDASVDGIGFDKFLTETVQYRFVDWLVRMLLYEIRDTGNTGAMTELYDALPKVDRAELNGQVTVKYTEDGREHRSQLGFDVIVRDRMGNPLIVANLNDSRDPATESMMTDLVRAAERVGETSSSLAGGFLVTRSFFEPEALETAEEATAGGLLSRGKQKSFVNLSRKGGYHLCLVEARNDEFHLAVPEL